LRKSPILTDLTRTLVLSAALALAGCSFFEAPAQVRGNRVGPDALKELVPGTSTRADVTSLLGSPTTRATFDDNKWVYIGEVTRPEIGRTQGVLQQQVIVLTFDQAGVLREVQQLTQKDSKPVDVVARATPSPGSSASFMQQLLGNVGRFNVPASTEGSVTTGGAPSASSP